MKTYEKALNLTLDAQVAKGMWSNLFMMIFGVDRTRVKKEREQDDEDEDNSRLEDFIAKATAPTHAILKRRERKSRVAGKY